MKQQLKHTFALAAAALLVTGTPMSIKAWSTAGHVYCDVNQNESIDAGDPPLRGVLVVVTNISGTYSNADFTTTPDGGFILELPNMTDTYVEYIHPLTLPGDAVGVLPPGGYHMFTLDGNQTNFLGDFLFSSVTCSNNPPPPPSTKGCCLKAEGTIKGGNGKPAYVFAGSAMPPCSCRTNDSGLWDVVSLVAKLHFEGCVLEIVDCGEITGTTNGCATHFIEFSGIGKLKGFAGCKADYGLVYFYARAEDHGGRGDSLYFRAYKADGTTLLLIGGDANNPANVVTVTICGGDIKVGTDCCPRDDRDGHGDHDGDEDDGHGDGHGHDGDCDKGHKGDKGDKGGKGNKGGKGGKGDDCDPKGKGDSKGGGRTDSKGGSKGK